MQQQQLSPTPRVPGAFSTGKLGAVALSQTATVSSATLLAVDPSKQQAQRQKKTQRRTQGKRCLQDLSPTETAVLISHVTKLRFQESECYFDGRLLALLDTWQEVVELNIGLPRAKAKLLFLKIEEFRDAGIVPLEMLDQKASSSFTSLETVTSTVSIPEAALSQSHKKVTSVVAPTQSALLKTVSYRTSEVKY
jgi:hypothetical protein